MENMYNENRFEDFQPFEEFGYESQPNLEFGYDDVEFGTEFGYTFDQQLVRTINHCEAVCLEMHTMMLRRQDMRRRLRQLELLRDCADVCGTTVRFIASRSRFARNMAGLCADICEECGNECARFPDRESQRCARICLNCARECRRFARY